MTHCVCVRSCHNTMGLEPTTTQQYKVQDGTSENLKGSGTSVESQCKVQASSGRKGGHLPGCDMAPGMKWHHFIMYLQGMYLQGKISGKSGKCEEVRCHRCASLTSTFTQVLYFKSNFEVFPIFSSFTSTPLHLRGKCCTFTPLQLFEN